MTQIPQMKAGWFSHLSAPICDICGFKFFS